MTTQTKKTASKYTAAHEARIREAAENGPLDQAAAEALAKEFGFTGRSVIAKINRMADVAYTRKQPTTKSGAPVERKDGLVSEIATLAGLNVAALDGLDKAPKAALQAVRDAFAAVA